MNVQTRIISAVSTAAVGMVVSRALAATWRGVTGEDPPEDVEDPDVALAKALTFALVSAGLATVTQLVIMRKLRARDARRHLTA